MKKILLLLTIGAGLLGSTFLNSCQTTEGFGRDLQKVGSEIEQEADETYRGY